MVIDLDTLSPGSKPQMAGRPKLGRILDGQIILPTICALGRVPDIIEGEQEQITKATL